MAEPEQDITGDNPSQHRDARAVDDAVLGRTPQSAGLRIGFFILLFILAFGTLFYWMNR